jgi:hypothetical protein
LQLSQRRAPSCRLRCRAPCVPCVALSSMCACTQPVGAFVRCVAQAMCPLPLSSHMRNYCVAVIARPHVHVCLLLLRPDTMRVCVWFVPRAVVRTELVAGDAVGRWCESSWGGCLTQTGAGCRHCWRSWVVAAASFFGGGVPPPRHVCAKHGVCHGSLPMPLHVHEDLVWFCFSRWSCRDRRSRGICNAVGRGDLWVLIRWPNFIHPSPSHHLPLVPCC